MIRNLTLTLSATGSLFFMSSLAGAQESSLEEQLDVVLAPELDLSAISESAISPAVPVVTPPVVKVDLSKQQAKQIEVPELEKIPEAELPPLLKSKTIKAQKAEKAETDDAGVLSGLLPWKKSDEIAPEDADGTPAPISSPAPEIIESATSAAPDVTAAIEKVKTAETQAASFTAALALAVGGEENLPTVADPVSTLPEQIDVGGEENKIGGFFSGVGNVFSRDDKGDKIEGTALPEAEALLPAPLPEPTLPVVEGAPAPVDVAPVAPISAPIISVGSPVESVEEKSGFLAGIGSKFKRDKKDEVVAVVKEEVFETVSQEPVAVASAEKKGGMFGMFSSDKKDEPEIESVEPDQSKSFGGLFSRKPKEESATNIDLTTEVESEESSSLFKGLLGGKKDKEQPEIETLEVESEKKLRIPNPFKGKKDKETAGSAEL